MSRHALRPALKQAIHQRVGLPAAPVVLDTFTRADSSTLGNAETGQAWTEDVGNLAIASGRLVATAVVSSQAICSLDSGLAEGLFGLKTTQGGAAITHASLLFRMVDASNFLMVRINGGPTQNEIQLYERVTGTLTKLAAVAFTPTNDTWYHLQVRANGTALSIRLDGNEVLTHSTSRHQAATRVGVRFFQISTTDVADDLSVYAL